MAEFDVIIKNGTIIDGTRVPRYRADLGIKNGKIAKIGRLNTSDAARVIDATGLIVAPGAIDLHTHYDAQIHWDPYCTTGSWHGITSVTLGNCGFGFAPLHAKDAERAMLALSRNEAIPLGDFLKRVSQAQKTQIPNIGPIWAVWECSGRIACRV